MARILLVDDDDSLRMMLAKTQTDFGHGVIEARDGREGLRRFGQAGADLVITDIVMPEKEGSDFLMDLREKELSVEVIAKSGAEEYLDRVRLLGAAEVRAKSFSPQDLIKAIHEFVPGLRPMPSYAGKKTAD